MSVKIALLGCGTVGSQVARLLETGAEDFQARVGERLELIGIAVRHLDSARADFIDKSLLTTDALSLIDRADLVIELMGGINPAQEYILTALKKGKSVVTGNKALLAQSGPVLYQCAKENGTDIYFEAAVAGAVPVVYGLRESLAGDKVLRVRGIVNGTTNYILDQMDQGASYQDALEKAQQLGYAEADPTADVEGHDAAAKCAILASLAFHSRVSGDQVSTKGIRQVSAEDAADAARTGHVIKLLATASRVEVAGETRVAVNVEPTLVRTDSPLASVRGAFNAIEIDSEAAGTLMFYGQGAGGAPTASAVLSDVVAAAGHIAHGGRAPLESCYARLPIADISQVKSNFRIRLRLRDDAGVLARVVTIFAEQGISLEQISQFPGISQGTSNLSISTHQTTYGEIDTVAARLKECAGVIEVASVLAMEGN